MYGCESWTIKKAEYRRIDTFNTWCWRRFLRVSWTARRSNESILKEINLEYSLEELTLKLPYFGHRCEEPTHWKRPRCWERLNAEGEGGDRRWDGWMASMINGHAFSKFQETVKEREDWNAAVHGIAKSRTRLSNWTMPTMYTYTNTHKQIAKNPETKGQSTDQSQMLDLYQY